MPLKEIEVKTDKTYGHYVEVKIDTKASKAIKIWLDLIGELKKHPLNPPVFVYWLGETDITPNELGKALADALHKMNLKPATKEPINSIEMIRELRKET